MSRGTNEAEVRKFIFRQPAALVPSSPRPTVEIVFSFDTTGSMSPYLEEVRKKLSKICQKLLTDIPDIRIGIIAHGDYCDAHRGSYVIKRIDLSNDPAALLKFVQGCDATGGGDFPECYELCIQEAKSFSWSANTVKSLVIIGDAPPHQPEEYIKIDWKKETKEVGAKNIRIHSVQCGGDYGEGGVFYKEIAKQTNGFHIKLKKIELMSELFTELCYREQQNFKDSFVPEPSCLLGDAAARKKRLINAVSSCMLKEPQFYSSVDAQKAKITELVKAVVADGDPEFVTKLAFYVREHLYIRTTASYLLALAANIKACHPFLVKYLRHTVKLPSDLIEIVSLYHSLPDKYLDGDGLPACLRKGVEEKFLDFDVYQLGKYKNVGSTKKTKKKQAKSNAEALVSKLKEGGGALSMSSAGMEEDDTHEKEEEDEEKETKPKGEKEKEKEKSLVPVVTLKTLIRTCHVAQPAHPVMCLLGKKYPQTAEEFAKTGLPGTFNPKMAGKRMKLKVPMTWETQLSAHGNKPAVWEKLLETKNLPFMAMLRNLRNMITVGISDKHHAMVLERLCDEHQVANSKQFPFRFLNAYESITFTEAQLTSIRLGQPVTAGKTNPRGAEREESAQKKPSRPPKHKPPPPNPPTPALVRKYHALQEALDTALKLSTVNNVTPLKGEVRIFCDVSGSMTYNLPKTTGKVYGVSSMAEMAVLLGMMIKYASERADFLMFSSAGPGSKGKSWIRPALSSDNILENFKAAKAEIPLLGVETDFPYDYLDTILHEKKKIDYFIVISDLIITPDKAHPAGTQILKKINDYRKAVNPSLCFVCIDLFGGGTNLVTGSGESPLDIYITGYSDQILRYIGARREVDSQLAHIEKAPEEIKEKEAELKAKQERKEKGKEEKGKEKEEKKDAEMEEQ